MGPKQRRLAGAKVTLSLTPLIDVTFQLVIFFMLVTELTNLSLADVRLPTASEAGEGGTGPVVINIVPTGDGAYLRIGTDEYHGQGQDLVEQLKQRLLLEAETYGLWTAVGDDSRMSELEVVVRSDRELPSEYFLYVMAACNDVWIYRIDAGAKKDATE